MTILQQMDDVVDTQGYTPYDLVFDVLREPDPVAELPLPADSQTNLEIPTDEVTLTVKIRAIKKVSLKEHYGLNVTNELLDIKLLNPKRLPEWFSTDLVTSNAHKVTWNTTTGMIKVLDTHQSSIESVKDTLGDSFYATIIGDLS